MRFLLTFFLFFYIIITQVLAQQVYPLHPSVGDTIDKSEKLDYSLFPFTPNTEFEYATIVFLQDSFFLDVKNFNDKSTYKEYLSKETLIEAQKTIEKVNQYYQYLAKQKKDTSNYQPQIRNTKAPPLRIEGPMTEQMKKEVRMNTRLKEDARRRREMQQGSRQGEFFIDFN